MCTKNGEPKAYVLDLSASDGMMLGHTWPYDHTASDAPSGSCLDMYGLTASDAPGHNYHIGCVWRCSHCGHDPHPDIPECSALVINPGHTSEAMVLDHASRTIDKKLYTTRPTCAIEIASRIET